MTRWWWLALLPAVTLVIGVLLWPTGHSEADTAKTEIEVFRGEYVWAFDGYRNEVEAIFTPTDDDRWAVEFHFTYGQWPELFTGEAHGSLHSGRIRGDVGEHGKASHRFVAQVDGDQLEGTHYELGSLRAKKTGTLRLERVHEPERTKDTE